MPSLETPPNPAPTPDPPVKVRTGRFGELEEHELVHLLDALDDERSRARFRESIYISVFIYLAIAWFLFYGPRVLFHQPRLISPTDVLKDREKQQLTYLDTPTNLSKISPKTPKNNAKPTPATRPTLDKKTLQKLQDMSKAGTPAPPAPAPAPQPPAPQPQQQQPPPPPAPQPQQQALVEAPKPAPTKPNFGNQNLSAGDAIRQAAQSAAHDHGNGGDYGQSAQPSRQGGAMNTGVQVLSDMQGVDFDPYLRRILSDIKRAWIPLIPEEARPPLNKQGETLIRFTILPDGTIAAMNLDGSTHDQAIDKACWGAITSQGHFPPLPAAFKGPNLELRIDFLTNKPLP